MVRQPCKEKEFIIIAEPNVEILGPKTRFNKIEELEINL